MERIGEYFAISFCKFGKNFKKVGKSLEKIGKSLGEIPVSASDYMNFSRDIHYFSRMQHPLIWKNIYPCKTGILSPPLLTTLYKGRDSFARAQKQFVESCKLGKACLKLRYLS